MSAKLKNIEKVSAALGITWDSHSDGSGTWIEIDNDNFSVCLCFDGKGEKFEELIISKKIWEVTDEQVIGEIKIK